ncbi:hypothetical protein AVEN_252774-1 [Araneus ventricosus]|uniref:Uncharacterized protein n=1 Tax=Araneus ventricosus TaxID=182803 RepID=A0A4Y2MJZ8_ARAVE|nr:hypothetical protein AVEN_252774-1 [Araneus ventricosus]
MTPSRDYTRVTRSKDSFPGLYESYFQKGLLPGIIRELLEERTPSRDRLLQKGPSRLTELLEERTSQDIEDRRKDSFRDYTRVTRTDSLDYES